MHKIHSDAPSYPRRTDTSLHQIQRLLSNGIRGLCVIKVLRRIFGPKRDEVTGECRKLHNEELRVLYSLPNIVQVVKSRRMRWAGHVVRMGRGEVCTGF